MHCPNCGHYESGNSFCTKCGNSITKRKCTNGHVIPEGLSDCPYCPKSSKGTVKMGGMPHGGTKQVFGMAGGTPHGGAKKTMVVNSPMGGGGPPRPMTPQSSRPQPIPGSPGPGPKKTMFAPPGGSGGPPKAIGNQPWGGATATHRSSPDIAQRSGQSPLIGFLTSFSKDPNGLFWPLRVGRVQIGADSSADVTLPYDGISGSHATIMVRTSKTVTKIWVVDDKSLNGTQVNGEEIFNDNKTLVHGDVVNVGDVELRVIIL